MIFRKDLGSILQLLSLIYLTFVIVISNVFPVYIFTPSNLSKNIVLGLSVQIIGFTIKDKQK